ALVPRSQPGAIVETPNEVVSRVVSMVTRQAITAIDGSQVRVEADTICVHGDTPGAANLAKRIRHSLVEAGVDVVSVGSTAGGVR
ncbi:MAG TPA: LamB/YcsF family protein, partial [Gemmatimonadales bacterium]|nr:LamB/YcsF family protein [Gemmatimonadales bacterium]